MSKFNRKKIAVTLAFAALFGDKTSAASTNKNQVKSSQALAASKINSAKSKKSWSFWAKILIGAGIIGEGYNEAAGIISGESLVTGKISVSNACRKIFSGKLQDDEQMRPDDESNEKGKKKEKEKEKEKENEKENEKEKENENENEEKGVDENTEIVEKLSDKFNVIKDKDGNLDNQKINLLKKALVEILKLENDKTILSQYSETVFNSGKTKFGDFLMSFINNLKNGNIVIQPGSSRNYFVGKVILGVGNGEFTVNLVCQSDIVNWIYCGRQVFRFFENQLKILPQ